MPLIKIRVAVGLTVLAVGSFGVVQAFQTGPTAPRRGVPRRARRARPGLLAVHKTPAKAPVLTAEEEMKTFSLPPGYHVELVAKEPLVMDRRS